eukprot:SAG31_NODE_128_length_23532_cov_21.204754_8_plen_767_part_00
MRRSASNESPVSGWVVSALGLALCVVPLVHAAANPREMARLRTKHDGAATPARCPFCPHTATAKVFGAAASGATIAAMGQLSANQTYEALQAAGIEILGSNIYKCTAWKQLPAQLAAAASRGIKIVAGIESESVFGKFCRNFKGPDGFVDWPGLAAQLANLSLSYPNLVGYRFDDFFGCCHLQQYGNFSSKLSRSVYYGGLPQDTARMQAAAKAINPNFKMLAVFYDAQLAFQSPFSFSFGQRAWLQPAIADQATAGHHGSFFPKGTSVTMRVSFELAQIGSQLRLDFLETTQFLYGVAPHAIALVQGLVRRRVSANGRCNLLDHDLANITDSLFPASTPQVVGRVFAQTVNVSSSCLNPGSNVLEWELFGETNLSAWYRTHKNFLSVWDIEISGPLIPRGKALVGNGSWSSVSFEQTESGIKVPASSEGQRPELFGGSNRPYSQLPHVDGVLLCWKQLDPMWSRDHGGVEQILYRRLLRSTRRALSGPDAFPGRKYSLFSTHFGMFDWKGWDAALANNPRLPRAGISPLTTYAQMMDDAWLSDGIFIWWDLVGIPADIAAQRGIFGPQLGRRAIFQCPSNQSYQYLQLKAVEGVGLLRGWYQSVTSDGEGVPAGSINISMITGHEEVLTTGFRSVVQLLGQDSRWVTVHQRGSNQTCSSTFCNTSAGNLVPGLRTCAVSCSSITTHVTLTLGATTMLRTRLEVEHDAGGALGVCVNAVSAPSSSSSSDFISWSFHSGIDPSLSSVVAEQDAIVNATKTIKSCTCN